MVAVRAPAHWKPVRLKFLIDMFGGGTPSKSDPGYWAGDIPWVSPKDMKRPTVHDTEDHISAAALVETATRRVEAGSVLVVVRSGILQHTLPVAINSVAVALNQDMKALSCRAALRPRYLFYVLSGLQSDLLMSWRMLGATVDSIDVERMRNTLLWVPPEQEQLRIIEYLDRETARIDSLIAARKRLADLLQERFHIQCVVALGLAGTLGEGRRLAAYATVTLGRQRSPEQSVGPFMTRYLRAANVKDGQLDLTDVMTMNFNPTEQKVFGLADRDILVSEGAGSLEAVGAAAVWHEDLAGVVCFQNTLLRLRPRPGTDPDYLAWWCRGAFFSGLLAAIASGANIFHLSAERMKSLRMDPPDLASQVQIARDLEAAEVRTRTAVEQLSRQLDLLAERRRALITAAVTGELEISEAV
jgi:type I restriction enzyme S subunit